MAETTGHVMVPIAVGELYDKISILEIKSERIDDAAKLKNVATELAMLNAIATELTSSKDGEVSSLRTELKAVNEAIWDAENLVRQARNEGSSGASLAAVAEYARLTYSNNDRRAAIKRRINELSGSLIVEEKSHSGRR